MVDALSPDVDSGGRLKIFFGYAPGVGKTHEMLEESLRRKNRGQNIVIGFVDANTRPGLKELLEQFETVPPLKISIQGTTVEEIDVEAILKLRPSTALVDDLAHENAPGAPNAYRWQDIRALLDAKISVRCAQKAHVGATGVTCYTCHRGMPVPANVWFDNPGAPRAVGFAATNNGMGASAKACKDACYAHYPNEATTEQAYNACYAAKGVTACK